MGVQLVFGGYESSDVYFFYPDSAAGDQQMSHSDPLSSSPPGPSQESSSVLFETDLADLMEQDESLKALLSSPLLPCGSGGGGGGGGGGGSEENCGDGVVPVAAAPSTSPDHSGQCPASSPTHFVDMDEFALQHLVQPHHSQQYNQQHQQHQQHHCQQQQQHQQQQQQQQHQFYQQHHHNLQDASGDADATLSTQDLLAQHFKALQFNKKQLPLQGHGSGPPPLHCWNELPPETWSQDDVLNWVYDFAGRWGIDEVIRGESFQNVDGYRLCQMTAQDFACLSESHAEFFYQELCHLKITATTDRGSAGPSSTPQSPTFTTSGHTPVSSTPSTSSCCLGPPESSGGAGLNLPPQPQPSSSSCSASSSTVPVRKRGRPRKHVPPEAAVPRVPKPRGRKPGQRSKGHHLWEFIRDLLLDPAQCPRIIRWEDRTNGIFRIVDSKTVSRLWGIQKKNRNMTYEKLSRAIRFCQKESVGYFSKLPESTAYPKKLCFKFGPKTSGWQNV